MRRKKIVKEKSIFEIMISEIKAEINNKYEADKRSWVKSIILGKQELIKNQKDRIVAIEKILTDEKEGLALLEKSLANFETSNLDEEFKKSQKLAIQSSLQDLIADEMRKLPVFLIQIICASEESRTKFLALPNFNDEIFKEITGIDVTANTKKDRITKKSR